MSEIPEWIETLADQLAENRYAILDDFIPENLINELRKSLLEEYQKGEFHKAGIGRQNDQQIREDIRGDYILWLDQCRELPCVQDYEKKVSELIEGINRTLYLGLTDSEIHFALYPVGTFYKRHLDRFKTSSRRTLSIITYINENWKDSDGGQLVIYVPTENGEEKITILPKGGRMVCFDSGLLEHEVLAGNRERCSVTGWLLR